MTEKTIDNDTTGSVLYEYEYVERVTIHKGAENMFSTETNPIHFVPVGSVTKNESELLQKMQASLDAMNELTQEVKETNNTSAKNAETTNRLSCAVYILTAGLFILTTVNIGLVVATAIYPEQSTELIEVSLKLLDLSIITALLFAGIVAAFFIFKWFINGYMWWQEYRKKKSSP